MAIYCYKCGKQNPDDANFCMGCAQPLKGGGPPPQAVPRHWEYKDIIIPFPRDRFSKIPFNTRSYDEVARLGDSIIPTCLQQEGHQGWQADGPTDFRSLDRLNLIQKREAFVTIINTRYTYEQVTIRLKRLVP